MPERELPEHLASRLTAELNAGAPLHSPLPAQARYATAAVGVAGERLHRGQRLATAAVAALTLILVGLVAGPPLLHSVGSRHQEPGPAIAPALASPSPEMRPSPSPSPATSPSPEPASTPDEHESPQPRETESPEPPDD